MSIPKTTVLYNCKFCFNYDTCDFDNKEEGLWVLHRQKDPKCFVNKKVGDQAKQMGITYKTKKRKRKKRKK